MFEEGFYGLKDSANDFDYSKESEIREPNIKLVKFALFWTFIGPFLLPMG